MRRSLCTRECKHDPGLVQGQKLKDMYEIEDVSGLGQGP
jgi:hypothetical protein